MAHSYFIKSIEESIDILQSTFKKIKNYDVHLTDNRFIKFFSEKYLLIHFEDK